MESITTFRDALAADLERTLESAGYEPSERTLSELRKLYADS